MSASKRPTGNAPRASDGFATLTADMMERGGATPPPLLEGTSDGIVPGAGQAMSETRPLFGKRTKPKQAPVRNKRNTNLAQSVAATQGTTGPHPCQAAEPSHQKVYSGPDRRKHDVSPMVERRRSVPPRVKVSVRLEQHRHQRLKGAGVLLSRTHQDIITVALDRYLDALGVLKGPHG